MSAYPVPLENVSLDKSHWPNPIALDLIRLHISDLSTVLQPCCLSTSDDVTDTCDVTSTNPMSAIWFIFRNCAALRVSVSQSLHSNRILLSNTFLSNQDTHITTATTSVLWYCVRMCSWQQLGLPWQYHMTWVSIETKSKVTEHPNAQVTWLQRHFCVVDNICKSHGIQIRSLWKYLGHIIGQSSQVVHCTMTWMLFSISIQCTMQN